MSNMNLPGVRRIEALIGVLKTKEKEAIAEASKTLPTHAECRRIASQELGLTELQAEVDAIEQRISDISDATTSAFGYSITLNKSYNYRSNTAHEKRTKELERELRDKPLDEIRAEYKRKESELWLVESIEQAKAIVGI